VTLENALVGLIMERDDTANTVTPAFDSSAIGLKFFGSTLTHYAPEIDRLLSRRAGASGGS
jgi:hypothetical protein